MILTHATSVIVGQKTAWRRVASCREWRDRRRYWSGRDGRRRAHGDVGKLFEQGPHTRAPAWCCTGAQPRAVVFPLPIAILILLVPLMRIDVHAMANVGGRYASLDMPHAEPDLSATLLANLKAYVAGGVIEAWENV
jgi:hypothetical protein